MGQREDVGVGAGAGHGYADAADAAGDLGADLEQPEPDGAAGRALERGVGQREAAQGGHQDVGHGGEPQAQLVGAHGDGAGAVGEEVELALLDAVLHVAAGAVDALVEGAGADLGGGQRGDDEAGVAPASPRPGIHSALATTRRLRLQLSKVRQRKSAKRRAGRLVRSASSSAQARST